MKFEIEYAQFTKVVVEAENKEEAETIASIMDGEDIAENDPHEYSIWNITLVETLGNQSSDKRQGGRDGKNT